VARLRKKPLPAPARAPALFVECEWVVAAIDAGLVERILLASDTTARTLRSAGTSVIDTGSAWAPAWDLDGALGGAVGRGPSWIVIRAPAGWPFETFALRAGRCVCVRAMPPSTELPPGLVEMPALRSAFATAAIPELAAYSTGVVLDPLRVPPRDQIARVAMELEQA
jgi:hypothetical protein